MLTSPHVVHISHTHPPKELIQALRKYLLGKIFQTVQRSRAAEPAGRGYRHIRQAPTNRAEPANEGGPVPTKGANLRSRAEVTSWRNSGGQLFFGPLFVTPRNLRQAIKSLPSGLTIYSFKGELGALHTSVSLVDGEVKPVESALFFFFLRRCNDCSWDS